MPTCSLVIDVVVCEGDEDKEGVARSPEEK